MYQWVCATTYRDPDLAFGLKQQPRPIVGNHLCHLRIQIYGSRSAAHSVTHLCHGLVVAEVDVADGELLGVQEEPPPAVHRQVRGVHTCRAVRRQCGLEAVWTRESE